ncbi:hypothetical protein BB558_002715 [Smittium angustum]|uniref:Uncharacterized protein n=1 Tax=Smittium angustum TaxID=133377 RepID=A0A2U1J7W3_SMIAN|nr:hypothetical protein BB558_002715 [Smittium angustum]
MQKNIFNYVQNKVEPQSSEQVKVDLNARYIILPGLKINTSFCLKNNSNSVHFKRELFTAKLKESELLSESFTKIKSITQKLYSMGSPVNDKDLAVASLISVPPLYKTVLTDVEHQKKIGI